MLVLLRSWGLFVLRCLPDKVCIVIKYFYHFHRFPRVKNPKTFNEKLQWLKLNDRDPLYPLLVDKFEMKEYVNKEIGEGFVIPTLGVWDSFDDIKFDSLPNQFVLKTTHDCGGIVICRDKTVFDLEEAKGFINQHLKYNYYYEGREWPYKSVKPRIIAEPYIIDSKVNELRDYKFFCFNGKVRCFKVDYGRFSKHGANYYSPDMHLLDLGENYCPPDAQVSVSLPSDNAIKNMIDIAEKLAMKIPFLRVDFYYVNGNILIGELTLYPNSGFGTFIDSRWDKKLGDWLNIRGVNYV